MSSGRKLVTDLAFGTACPVREDIPATFEELMAQLGPLRSAEEMDAEIVDAILAIRQASYRDSRWEGVQ